MLRRGASSWTERASDLGTKRIGERDAAQPRTPPPFFVAEGCDENEVKPRLPPRVEEDVNVAVRAVPWCTRPATPAPRGPPHPSAGDLLVLPLCPAVSLGESSAIESPPPPGVP
ncbi:unnamed protein product [Lampetra planeri]